MGVTHNERVLTSPCMMWAVNVPDSSSRVLLSGPLTIRNFEELFKLSLRPGQSLYSGLIGLRKSSSLFLKKKRIGEISFSYGSQICSRDRLPSMCTIPCSRFFWLLIGKPGEKQNRTLCPHLKGFYFIRLEKKQQSAFRLELNRMSGGIPERECI